MKKYLLKVGINVRLKTQSVDYTEVNSLVDFSEIEDKETRDNLISSFLKSGLIEETDAKEDKAVKKEPEEVDETTDEDEENDDLEEVEDDRPAKKATRVRGGKK